MSGASVQWFPQPTMRAARPGQAIYHHGSSRQFESIENAMRFVMEDLSDYERPTAMILIDNGTIHYDDIERFYRAAAVPAS